ncbi:hypothetical protein BsWGS_20767 [Bradybaena similaris]
MLGGLKGLLLLCLYAFTGCDMVKFMQASIGETGEFFCGNSDNWSPENPGSTWKRFVQNVTFNTPFILPPVIFLTVTYLESVRNFNVRFLAKFDHVSERGFEAMCLKWSDTKIIEMRVNWLAISGAYLEKASEFYCDADTKWTPGHWNPKDPKEAGKRSSRNVQFPTEFSETPLLVLSVTYLDCDHRYNLRFQAQVENVTRSGFSAMCYTWADTRIWEMKISWLAIPTYFLGQTGEFYCGSSNSWTKGLGNPKHPKETGRRFVQNITFPTPFIFQPSVFLSVTYLYSDRLSDLRFLTQVDHVSRNGFGAMCYTWSDTKIYEMRITWFAF